MNTYTLRSSRLTAMFTGIAAQLGFDVPLVHTRRQPHQRPAPRHGRRARQVNRAKAPIVPAGPLMSGLPMSHQVRRRAIDRLCDASWRIKLEIERLGARARRQPRTNRGRAEESRLCRRVAHLHDVLARHEDHIRRLQKSA